MFHLKLDLRTNIKMTPNGVACIHDGMSVFLDPKWGTTKGISFVSHAHIDHLHNQSGGLLLTSRPTSEIARMRGFCLDNFVENMENFSMVETGHILGARGLVFGDDVFYTGDICTRNRGFMKGAKLQKCKTLITECTFGLPEFAFPGISETVKKVNGIISEMYAKGKPVILLGYELGKSQILSYLFADWQPYFHDSIKKVNDLYRNFGIDLKEGIGHTEAEKKGLLDKKPWVMIAPNMNQRNSFVQHMKSKYGAITIGFSGWAQSTRFSFGRQHDYSIALSDHCDYNELIELVRKCNPEKIYTIHGFVEEFAGDLVKLGFDAQPLVEGSMDEFF